MRERRCFIPVVACVAAWMMILTPVAAGDDAPPSGAELVREGNRLLDEGRYADALTAYDRAAEQLPDAPEVAYNRGLALYRQREYAKASPAFQDAIKPGRPELEAMAKYNLGRCAHASAIYNRENIEAAVNDLSRAIRFYQDTLQITPDDADAKKNTALAERLMAFLQKKLEEQKQQEKQQQQPTSQPDEQQPPTSQPDQQQPTSQPTSQPQDKQQQEQQGEGQDEKQDQKQQGDKQQDESQEGRKGKQDERQQGEQPDENKQENKQDGEQGQSQKVMSREEAEAKLQEARDSERKRREEKRERAMRRQGLTPPDKDW